MKQLFLILLIGVTTGGWAQDQALHISINSVGDLKVNDATEKYFNYMWTRISKEDSLSEIALELGKPSRYQQGNWPSVQKEINQDSPLLYIYDEKGVTVGVNPNGVTIVGISITYQSNYLWAAKKCFTGTLTILGKEVKEAIKIKEVKKLFQDEIIDSSSTLVHLKAHTRDVYFNYGKKRLLDSVTIVTNNAAEFLPKH